MTVEGIAWYTMPGATFPMPDGRSYEGYSGNGWIVLASAPVSPRLKLTEHELAHKLVTEVIYHGSPFWIACGWFSGVGTTFTIPGA